MEKGREKENRMEDKKKGRRRISRLNMEKEAEVTRRKRERRKKDLAIIVFEKAKQ